MFLLDSLEHAKSLLLKRKEKKIHRKGEMPQLYLISSKKKKCTLRNQAKWPGPEDIAPWACLGTHLPGFTAAPTGIRGDPKAPAAWLLGHERELPHSTAYKGAQVPTGGAENTAAASQEEEGHGAEEKVCQFHAVPPKREKKEFINRSSCPPWGSQQCVGGYQRDLTLSISEEMSQVIADVHKLQHRCPKFLLTDSSMDSVGPLCSLDTPPSKGILSLLLLSPNCWT